MTANQVWGELGFCVCFLPGTDVPRPQYILIHMYHEQGYRFVMVWGHGSFPYCCCSPAWREWCTAFTIDRGLLGSSGITDLCLKAEEFVTSRMTTPDSWESVAPIKWANSERQGEWICFKHLQAENGL